MKTKNASLVRCIASLSVGLLLIMWPDLAVTNLVRMIGVLFLLPALFTLSVHVYRKYFKHHHVRSLPQDAIGATLFGTFLICNPGFFINGIMFVLGFLLLLASAYQIYVLLRLKKYSKVSWGILLMPCLILFVSFVMLFKPAIFLANLVVIFGIICIFYGLMELVFSFWIYRKYDSYTVIESNIHEKKSQ